MEYDLHQKAVDPLSRVFALDADNIAAHERLEDLLLSQGREQEPEPVLLRLAELVALGDPDRAELDHLAARAPGLRARADVSGAAKGPVPREAIGKTRQRQAVCSSP